MKEHLNEGNMRRENEPVSTTLDVGLNNNQLERESQSPTGSEDIENENFWETDSVGLSANYEWSSESASSVDPEESLPEYGWTDEQQQQQQQQQQDNRPNNWKSDDRSGQTRSNGSVRRDRSPTGKSAGYYWSDNGDDTRALGDAINEYNNNEAAVDHLQHHNRSSSIAGGSVNQLDVRKNNEEKIFYEKPKLNIQTVTYLYEGVLPSTVKCMNYVNSIKASSSSVDDLVLLTPEEDDDVDVDDDDDDDDDPAVSSVQEVVPEVASVSEAEDLEEVAILEEEVDEDRPSVETILDEDNVSSGRYTPPDWPLVPPASVEVVELTKSVKEVIQFPEIEEIADTGNVNSQDCHVAQRTYESEITDETSSSSSIEHIDLIREAKELTIEQKSKLSEIKKLPSCCSGPEERTGKLGEAGHSQVAHEEDEVEPYDDEALYEERSSPYAKIEEIDLLSSIGRDIGVNLEKYVQPVPDVVAMETLKPSAPSRSLTSGLLKQQQHQPDAKIRPDTNKLVDNEMPDVSSSGPDTRKKEKMARNQARRRQATHSINAGQTRRSDKRRADHIVDPGSGGFDVYNIETAMPKIDLDAIESHLRAAREEERRENERVAEVVEAVAAGHEPQPANNRDKEDLLARFNRLLEGDTNVSYQRRNDREEIRRRLAMGPDAEDLRTERGRKPSLQSRLQSGMNLQICFMNETPSDTESPSSENDVSASPGSVGGRSSSSSSSSSSFPNKLQQHQLASRPQILSLPPLRVEAGNASTSTCLLSTSGPLDEADFFARQARLQTEARMALAQAKEMAHMQMEVERQRLKQSPITEMVRSSLEKVGVQLGEDRRRLSRVLLTELNVAQLQVVANDLHARIAMLNEALVEGLLRRDDLHMEQDSMLVDVEDLTRHLGAKQESLRKRSSASTREQQQFKQQQHSAATTSKNHRANNHGTIMARTALTRDKMMKCLSTRRAA